MFTRVTSWLYRLRRSSLQAFTLLECLVALLVISGSVLVYDSLTQSVTQNVHYLSDNQESDWLLFAQQLRSELAGSRLDKVGNHKLYVTQAGQQLAFGLSRADDFRKTNASGQGYQPMLFGVESSAISQKGQVVTIRLRFESGLERSFVYAFDAQG